MEEEEGDLIIGDELGVVARPDDLEGSEEVFLQYDLGVLEVLTQRANGSLTTELGKRKSRRKRGTRRGSGRRRVRT